MTGLTATAARMALGHALARLREDAGMTIVQASQATGVGEKVISQIERGQAGPGAWDISGLYSAYGLNDPPARVVLLNLAYQGSRSEWWHAYRDLIPGWLDSYVALEQSATLIRSYAPHAIPALLQTPDYARAAIAAPGGEVPARQERQLQLRMTRQRILHGPAPVRLWAVIDEAALRRPAGSRTVMRGQLEHLIQMCSRPHVTLGVLPFGIGTHPGSAGPFAVLRLPDRALPDYAFTEHQAGGHGFADIGHLDYFRHTLNQLSLKASSAGPAQEILTQILGETSCR